MRFDIMKKTTFSETNEYISYIRTEKTLEKAIEKRLFLEKLEDNKQTIYYISINIDNVFDYIRSNEEKPLVLTEEVA